MSNLTGKSATIVVDPRGTADAVTIAEAVAKLPAGGGTIAIREGTYNVSSTITLPKDKSIRFVGVGGGDNNGTSPVRINLGANVIKLFTMETDATFLYSNDLQFENFTVVCDGVVGQGFIETPADSAWIYVVCKNLIIKGMEAFWYDASGNGYSFEFHNCFMYWADLASARHAIRTLDTYGGTFSLYETSWMWDAAYNIRGGFEGSTQCVLKLYNSSTGFGVNTTIDKLFAQGSSYIGADQSVTLSTDGIWASTLDWFVYGNAPKLTIIKDNSWVSGSWIEWLVDLASTADLNAFEGCGFNDQVTVKGGVRNRFVSCSFEGAVAYGIDAEATSDNLQVIGCAFTGATTAGIRLTNSTECQVVDCNFDLAAVAAIVEAGTSTNNVFESNRGADVSTYLAKSMFNNQNVQAVSGDQLLDGTFRTLLVDANGAEVDVTLPAAASSKWWLYYVKKTDASGNAVVIAVTGGGNIDAAATLSLAAQNDATLVISDGTQWWTLSKPAAAVGGVTLSSATGSSADAYASILSLAGASGIIGHGTVKNTLGANTLTIKRSATDAFGTSSSTEDDILPSSSLSYDISEPIGTAVPPYTAFAIEVKSKVGGASSDYSLKNTSIV